MESTLNLTSPGRNSRKNHSSKLRETWKIQHLQMFSYWKRLTSIAMLLDGLLVSPESYRLEAVSRKNKSSSKALFWKTPKGSWLQTLWVDDVIFPFGGI